MKAPMQVLVIDIGGTSVKILASGQTERRKFPSGKGLTPRKMVAAIDDYLGARGLQKLGKKKWRKTVEFAVERFTSALLLDDVVIGGGNAKKLKQAPPGCWLGSNANAFLGGFRMWEPATSRTPHTPQGPRDDQPKKAKGART